MKKILLYLLYIISIAILLIGIAACNSEGTTYYEVSDDSLRQNSWVTLKNGKWEDETGASGTYKTSGSSITFFEDDAEVASGTLQNGTLTLKAFGMTLSVYRTEKAQKKIASDSAPYETPDNSQATETAEPETEPKTVTITLNPDGGDIVQTAVAITPGEALDLPVPTRRGYTFVGWYNGDYRFTDETGKSIWNRSVREDTTLEAMWMIILYNVTVNSNNRGARYNGSGKYAPGDTVTLSAVSAQSGSTAGYTFLGWYDGNVKVSEGDSMEYTFTMPEEDKSFRAEWASFTLSTCSDHPSGGSITNYSNVVTQAGSEINLTASVLPGYTWLGWYDGDNKLSEGNSTSATYTMPKEDKILTARYSKTTLIKSPSDSAGSITELSDVYYIGDQVSVTATTNPGYTWLGWYDGENKVSAGTNSSYLFTMSSEDKYYEAKWAYYTVTTDTNLPNAGTYTQMNQEKVTVGDQVSVTATTNPGYTWLGWYDGEDMVSENTSLEYEFQMTADDIVLIAKWYQLTLEKTINTAGSVSYPSESYFVGDEVTAHATVNTGYLWLGWYDGETKLNDGDSFDFTFTMPETAPTYTAKFAPCTEHNLQEDCVCSICGKTVHGAKEDGNYCRHGNTVYFGSYPQSEVWDSDILSVLNAMAGDLPTASNRQKWTSYQYLTNGTVSNYMWYMDLAYAGERYRGVYFTKYRPYDTSLTSGTTRSYQDDSGYTPLTAYWFRYEPIGWRILDDTEGNALLLSEYAIDSQAYYSDLNTRGDANAAIYPNNYAESNIRAFLNDTFYQTAFTETQKAIINLTLVDNSAVSTNPDTNPQNFNNGVNDYACGDTEDYLFLLSRQEITCSAYGFSTGTSSRDQARYVQPTAYARAQGFCAKVYTDDYLTWWLRSPSYSNESSVYSVNQNGNILYSHKVNYTDLGVRPALRMDLR